MRLYFTIIFACIAGISFNQTIPYNNTPDWESTIGEIATGLGIADINGDGYKDLVCANGNDIQRQHLVVYYNNGDGSFPDSPSWQSADIDYHGHCAVGDIDKDGHIDVAVSVYLGAAGFSEPGKVKVYYNTGNALETSPSFESVPFYTFSCALGDADGDGDLDLAVAAGEPYSELFDEGKIFINTDGTFQSQPEWESDILMGALDVEFGDVNLDGGIDLIFGCEYTPNYIYLSDGTGIYPTTPSWSSTENENFINSIDIGYWNDPRESIVVMTENDQLGGLGRVRMYDFAGGVPASSNAEWYSNSFGFGSGIILADVSADGILDLIYGGWWLPMKIALGDGTGFELNSSYTSFTSSVVEAIQLSDLGKESYQEKTETFTIIPGGLDGANAVVLEEQIVEEIVSIVWNNGLTLEYWQYTWTPNKNWISFVYPFTAVDVVDVTYKYSPHPDIVITNWDNSKGNYIFYNTNPPLGIGEGDGTGTLQFSVYPQPASDEVNILFSKSLHGSVALKLTTIAGREIDVDAMVVDGTVRLNVRELMPGPYILTIRGSEGTASRKIIVN
jgi:hypothetical protein